jgi:hypothetical protein
MRKFFAMFVVGGDVAGIAVPVIVKSEKTISPGPQSRGIFFGAGVLDRRFVS